MLFQTYFQSCLLYASEIWLNIDEATINKLDEVDNKFWNLLPKDIVKPNCLTSAQAAVKKNLMFYFKLKHKMATADLDYGFTFMQSDTNTGLSKKRDLLLPKSRLAFRQKEFISVNTKL